MMKNSLKGAILSGLIFPGLGQLVFKQYMRGLALMVAVSASLLVIVVKGVQTALAILEKIESEGGIIDIDTLTNAVTQATSRSDSLIFNFAFFLISLCWIIGIIDAYKTGKKKDNQEYRSN